MYNHYSIHTDQYHHWRIHHLATPSRSTMPTSSSSISNKLLLELYNLSKTDPLIVRHKNGTTSSMTFTPVCRTDASFKQKGEKHIDEMIKKMSDNEKSTYDNNGTNHKEYSSAQRVVNHLVTRYPSSYQSVISKLAIKSNPIVRLDKYETSALIEYMDITEYTAYEKLNRFI